MAWGGGGGGGGDSGERRGRRGGGEGTELSVACSRLGTIEKAGGHRAGSANETDETWEREKERAVDQTSLVARPLFRSSPLTESLEQAKFRLIYND